MNNCWETAVNLYRSLGWFPGHTGRLVWIRAGRLIDALEVPRPIGERAVSLLPTVGPLFEAPDSHPPHWVFLTEPAQQILAAAGIDHITAGRTVDLPPSRFGPNRLHWLSPPTAQLPPFITVADALVKVAR
jgi:hypothetical protein